MADDAGPEPSPLDLTPRPSRPGTGTRRPGAIALVLVVVGALVYVLLRTLGDASLFFYDVAKAVELRSELGDGRFRVVGTPEPGLVVAELDGGSAVVFTLCAGDVLADVVHMGDPAELFQPGVPVVLQGAWTAGRPPGVDGLSGAADDGWFLRTDHMVVKHDNDYRSDGAELEPCGEAG